MTTSCQAREGHGVLKVHDRGRSSAIKFRRGNEEFLGEQGNVTKLLTTKIKDGYSVSRVLH